jgi:hypothetical protein
MHQVKTGTRAVPDSTVSAMQKQKDFLYANDSSYWKEQERQRQSGAEKIFNLISRSAFLKILLYIFLICGIIYAVYQVMIVNNFFIFSKATRKGASGQNDEMEDSYENFDENIRTAVENKNYRQAIRYMYLRTLKSLNDNNLIKLHAKSTNQDYVKQMYNHTGLNQFRNLTYIYEYVWYGEFHPDETQFERIRTNFNQFNSSR